MTDATERGWMEKCDIFLDPFTLPADRDSLEFSMNKVCCWFNFFGHNDIKLEYNFNIF